MSFGAQVFRILIASPSDVDEERQVAVQTIQDWNDRNAADRQIVLLPLRWESHSAPEYGKPPQEIINRQVVDSCDLAVGIFWTRVGSPTVASESGTVEEIERVANEGKTVMLYFSKIKECPDDLDLDQVAKLREFKSKTLPNALVETYSTVGEFRDKLLKQIDIQLKTLVAKGSNEALDISAKPITDIVIHFADPNEAAQDAGDSISAKTLFLDIEDFDQVPDYLSESSDKNDSLRGLFTLDGMNEVNRDYYRELIAFPVLSRFFAPVRFWLKNRGAIGARDVYVDLTIRSDKTEIIFILRTDANIPSRTPSTTKEQWLTTPTASLDLLQTGALNWNRHFELKALQPQRELTAPPVFLVGAKDSCEITVAARIYADTLPVPIDQTLKILLQVERKKVVATDVVAELKAIELQNKRKETETTAGPNGRNTND